jgi:hypothetical protein
MFKKTKLFNVPIPHFGTFEEFALLCGSKEGTQIKTVWSLSMKPFHIYCGLDGE